MDAIKILWLKKTTCDEWHGFVCDSWAYVVEKMETEECGWRVVLHKVDSGDVDILPEGSSVQDGKDLAQAHFDEQLSDEQLERAGRPRRGSLICDDSPWAKARAVLVTFDGMGETQTDEQAIRRFASIIEERDALLEDKNNLLGAGARAEAVLDHVWGALPLEARGAKVRKECRDHSIPEQVEVAVEAYVLATKEA